MKLKYIITPLVFFASLFNGFSQTPGYLGKHFTVGYSANLFPAIIGPTSKSDIGLNLTHCINLEYTIRNRTNLCFSFQHFKTGADFNYHTDEVILDQNSSYQNVTYKYYPTSALPSELSSNNLSIGLKFFHAGTLAPVGKYRKFELVFFSTKLLYEPSAFEAEYYDTYYYNTTTYKLQKTFGTGEYDFKSFALTYTIGRQRVLFDCLVIDYGFQLGVHPAGLYSFAAGDLVDSGSTALLTPEEYSKVITNQRLFRYESFNFHIGLGFLAF